MRAIRASFLAFISTVCAFSQIGRLDGGSVNGTGFRLYWETRLEPASPALAENLGTAQMWGTETFTRILMNRERRTYFGYRMTVSIESDNSYSIAWTPQFRLTPELARVVHIDDPEAWRQQPTGWDATNRKIVRPGDVIALDLMVSPQTGQKIVEYITIQEPFRLSLNFFNNPAPREFSYVGGAPREFRAEDAELRLREPLFTINGKVEESSRGSLQDISGPTVWLLAPGKGRFVLSLTPRPGFQKAGEVRGTSLSFKWGADTFGISSASRIVAGDAAFNLYVSHDAGGGGSFFQMGL